MSPEFTQMTKEFTTMERKGGGGGGGGREMLLPSKITSLASDVWS